MNLGNNMKKLTMDQPAIYQIRVPGEFNELWSDWGGKMVIKVERPGDRAPITTLTGIVDQAALIGLLRQLYSRGLPLISVVYLESDGEE